jgi:hypothetical protein
VTRELEAHAYHAPNSVAYVAEYNAFFAGLELARRFARQGKRVALINDSEAVYKTWNARQRPQFQEKTGGDECRAMFDKAIEEERKMGTAFNNITVNHMLRAEGNPADYYVGIARTRNEYFGDQTLFHEVAHMDQRRHQRNAIDAGSEAHRQALEALSRSMMDVGGAIKTVGDFAKIRRYHVRTRVPEGAIAPWSVTVKHLLRVILQTNDIGLRSTALITLLALPTMFLAQNASLQRIADHLANGRPFHIDLVGDHRRRGCAAEVLSQSTTEPPRQLDPQERLSRHVGSLVKNFRVKAAVSAMQNAFGPAPMAASRSTAPVVVDADPFVDAPDNDNPFAVHLDASTNASQDSVAGGGAAAHAPNDEMPRRDDQTDEHAQQQ